MAQDLPREGLVAVVKRDCPTCVMASGVLGDLARLGSLTVYTQDDPSFPETVPQRIDDTALDVSHRLKIEIVPTLIRFAGGREVDRTYGWDRGEWQRLTGIAELGRDMPETRPGCGAKNIEPGVVERLKVRFNETGLRSRRIEIGAGPCERQLDRRTAPARIALLGRQLTPERFRPLGLGLLKFDVLALEPSSHSLLTS